MEVLRKTYGQTDVKSEIVIYIYVLGMAYLNLMFSQRHFVIEDLPTHCARSVHMSFHMFPKDISS